MKSLRFIIISLLILNLSINQAYSQGSSNAAFLEIGVKVGDTFDFEIESINNDLPYLELVVDPRNVSAEDDAILPKSFSITVLEIDNDQENPRFYWVDVVDDNYALIAYQPRIEVLFESSEFTGNSFLNLHVGDGIVTTNNWDRVETLFAFQKLNPLLPEWEFDYSIEEDGDLIIINSHTVISDMNETIFGFSSANTNSVISYNKLTGVLQEEKTSGNQSFINGSTVDINYHILNTAFKSVDTSIVSNIVIGIGILQLQFQVIQ